MHYSNDIEDPVGVARFWEGALVQGFSGGSLETPFELNKKFWAICNIYIFRSFTLPLPKYNN